MSSRNHTRRTVLRTFGIVSVGGVLSSGTAIADLHDEGEETHTIRVTVVDSLTGDRVPEYGLSINGGLVSGTPFSEGVTCLQLPAGETFEIRAAAYPEHMHGVRRVEVTRDKDVTISIPPGPQHPSARQADDPPTTDPDDPDDHEDETGDEQPDDDEPSEETHTLTVAVIDAESSDLLPATVTVSEPSTGFEDTATSAEDAPGIVNFEVPDGTYSIDASAEGYQYFPETTESMVEVDGEDVDVEVQLWSERETHTLTMTVLDDETDEPIEGANIAGVGGLPGAADALMGRTTDASGVAVIDAVAPISPYDTTVEADGYETWFDWLDIQADTELTVRLVPDDSPGNGSDDE